MLLSFVTVTSVPFRLAWLEFRQTWPGCCRTFAVADYQASVPVVASPSAKPQTHTLTFQSTVKQILDAKGKSLSQITFVSESAAASNAPASFGSSEFQTYEPRMHPQTPNSSHGIGRILERIALYVPFCCPEASVRSRICVLRAAISRLSPATSHIPFRACTNHDNRKN